MDAMMRDSGGGTVVRENVCPRCGRSGGVEFWKSDNQKDLMGRSKAVAVKLGRPRCRKCGASFDRDELQEEETGRVF